MPLEPPLDVAIVGAGICGVIALYYARRAGLNARVFEREAGVGGLWRKLPPWQDIQIAPHDWALGHLGVDSPFQPGILKNIEDWVAAFALADGIALQCPVLSARHEEGLWQLTTAEGPVRAVHLIAASGAHNRPYRPAVSHEASDVRECHSSELRDASELKGRRVLVVGGGASAFDLLDLCFEHGAASVAWAYRSVRWMTPSRKPKQVVGNLREFSRMQAAGATPEQLNQALASDLRGRYEKFGLQDLMPTSDIDVRRHQIVPGRRRMIDNFGEIHRFQADVSTVQGATVTLSSGDMLEADLLLWGTGYEVDLSYFDSPTLAAIRSVDALSAHCGGVFVSLDEPNLYFPAVGLDGIGSAPFFFAQALRTTMSHIQGRARLDKLPVPYRLNHFDFVRYLAARDAENFPSAQWQADYRDLADTPDGKAFPIP